MRKMSAYCFLNVHLLKILHQQMPHQKSCIKHFMSLKISTATSTVAREENAKPKCGISKTEEIESPGERLDVINGKSSQEECTVLVPPYNSIKNYLFVGPNTNSSLDIEGMQVDGEFSNLEFSQFGISSDATEETIPVLPPYDPIKNYLSPRPDFLRYRPIGAWTLTIQKKLMVDFRSLRSSNLIFPLI